MSTRPPPRQVGRYLLYEALASGGMATVYLARMLGQEGFSRTVAVKQLYPHFALDQDFVSMFLDEARISSRIRHPNVVAPLDILVEGPELFIAMEYVHGEALSTLVSLAGGPVPPPIASAILVQVLLGLHAAHEATGERGQPLDIVHRDVSPQNILVGGDGVSRIVDFGIAKATSRAQTTRDGRLKGKLGYMAPEQIRQQPTDRRVDLFTSGIVLWELLTGRTLFSGDNPGAVLESILSCRVQPPSELVPISAELEAVVLCALAPDPAERFQTAKAMAAALGQAMPVASTLTVSTWVEELAGAQLVARARRVAEIEHGEPSHELPSTPPPTQSAPYIPPLTATLDAADAAPPAAAEAAMVPAAAPSSNTDLSITPSSTMHSVRPVFQRRTLVLGGAAVGLVASATVLGFSLRDEAEEPAAPQAVGAQPSASTLSIDATRPPTVETPSAPSAGPDSSRAAAPIPSASMSVPVAAPPPNPPRKAASLVQARPPAAPASPVTVVPSSAAKPYPSGARPAARTPALKSRCATPYVVDANGIKRFKSECF